MKKMLLGLSTLLTMATQAQTVVTFDDLTLSPNSHYDGSDGSGGFTSNGVFFENTYDTQWSYWSNGFIYSSSTDVTTAGYTNDFSAITGIGANGSQNYSVNYGGNIDFGTAKVVSSVAITNTTYAYLSMLNGDSFGKQFGDSTNASGTYDGTNGEDFFRLLCIGKDENSVVTDTVVFYLADYRFANNTEDYLVNNWETVDLTALGSIRYLEFALESSDVGQFGMNTPAYFALDNLTYGTLSVSENHLNRVSMYPNPATELVHIEGSGILRITGINGQTVLQQSLEKQTELSIAHFPNGTYIVEIFSESGISRSTLVKY